MRDIKHDVERCVALFLLIERQFGDGDKNVTIRYGLGN